MVVTRSQSRALVRRQQEEAVRVVRQAQVVDDFPGAALRNHWFLVEPATASEIVYTGDRLIEVAPAESDTVVIPALQTHLRRWVIERLIFGQEVSLTLEIGAETSAFAVDCLASPPLRQRSARRWGSRVLQPR